MADVLAELVAKITADATELKQGLSEGEKATEASSKKMADSLKKVGMAMAASGAAITAALGFMGKAAVDEEININRLAGTLATVGVSYDEVKDSLEGLIATTQRKTGIADTEQREMLSRLVLITQDYDAALKLLPIALDLAADAQMDTTTAATYLSKAYLDLEDGAKEVSVRFGMAAIKFKSLEDIQARVAGKAEALANPLNVLKASIGDVAEAIGSNLIPLIKGAVGKIVDIAIKVQEWAKEHPKLAKVLTLVALGLGGVLTAIGGLILIMPGLIATIIAFGVVFHAALGPIGLISLAIAGLIAAGILLWKNWDKVVNFFKEAFSTMKIVVLSGVDAMLGYLEKFMGWIPGIGDKIKSARDAIAGMIDRERISRDIKDLERDLESLTKTVKEEFDKQASKIQASYDKQRAESKKAYDAAVDAINKEYGIGEAAKDVSETKINAAKQATTALKELYKREEDAAKDRYNLEMQQVKDLYSERLRVLNAETDAQVRALQNQIDAIDAQTEAEELAITRAEEKKRLAELKGVYESAITAEDKAKAKEEWDKYAAEVARKELLRTRKEEKDALRDQIEEARERATEKKTQIQAEEDAVLASLKTKYDAELKNYRDLAFAADRDLEDELKRIERERVAKIAGEKLMLDAELLRLDTVEKAEIKHLADQLERANTQVKEINLAYDNVQKRYDIEIVTHYSSVYTGGYGGGAGATVISPEIPLYPWGPPLEEWESYQKGGIIRQPTLALLGEGGPEAVIPLNKAEPFSVPAEHEWAGPGNITINFTQPTFFDREDTMNKFVDMIVKGIQRQYRLRFGGAYSG